MNKTRASPSVPREFAAIDEEEHTLYREISSLLAEYRPTITPEAFSELPGKIGLFRNEQVHLKTIIDRIRPLCARLLTLQNEHLEATRAYFEHPDSPIWVKQITEDISLIPTSERDHPTRFLTKQYHDLIDKILDFSAVGAHSSEAWQIKSMLLKILSRPAGQRLIIKLNALGSHTGKVKIELGSGMEIQKVAAETSDRGFCTDVSPVPYITDGPSLESEATYRPFYKSHQTKGVFSAPLVLQYDPSFFQPSSFRLTGGKDSLLSFVVPFIALAHELIHVLHLFRGMNRRHIAFRHDIRHPLYHLYSNGATLLGNVEEFWTVELAHLSENLLRLEHGLSLRGSKMILTESDLVELSKPTYRMFALETARFLHQTTAIRLLYPESFKKQRPSADMSKST